MLSLAQLSPDIRQYLVVTGNYWAFTLTDGAFAHVGGVVFLWARLQPI